MYYYYHKSAITEYTNLTTTNFHVVSFINIKIYNIIFC